MAKFRDKLERATILVKNNTITREVYVEKDQEYKAAVREWERCHGRVSVVEKGCLGTGFGDCSSIGSEPRPKFKRSKLKSNVLLVCAPITGELLQVNIRLGEQVSAQPGQSLMCLAINQLSM